MAAKILRVRNIFSKLIPGLAMTVLCALQLWYHIAEQFVGLRYVSIIEIFWAVVEAVVFVFGVRCLIRFALPLRAGEGGKCCRMYAIDRDDLNADMNGAERIKDVYVGRKYVMYSGLKSIIIPIDRLIYVYGTFHEHVTVFDFFIEIWNMDNFFVFTDDYGRNIKFPIKNTNTANEIFDKLISVDPAIITPADPNFRETRGSFNYVRDLVEARRKDPARVPQGVRNVKDEPVKQQKRRGLSWHGKDEDLF